MASMPSEFVAIIPCLAERAAQGIVHALHVPRRGYKYEFGDLTVPSRFTGISWENYMVFLTSLGDRHVRHFYNQGTLEIMSPSKNHDLFKKRLARLVESMAWKLKISIQCVGSMTVTSELTERGFEPDESYYIAHEPIVRCKPDFEPDIDPPPDLIIEIEVSRNCSDKLALYSAMKVPELWRYDGEQLSFFIRSKRGVYRATDRSLAFPFLTINDLTPFLEKFNEVRENEVVTGFVRHAQKCWREYQKSSET